MATLTSVPNEEPGSKPAGSEEIPIVQTGLWYVVPSTGERFAVVLCGSGGQIASLVEERLLPVAQVKSPRLYCHRCHRKHPLMRDVMEAVDLEWMTTTDNTDRESVMVDVRDLISKEVRSLRRVASESTARRIPAIAPAVAR